METLVILGMILGIAGGVLATLFFYQQKSNRQLHQQSQLLLEQVRQVCKLITVEGEFSEIFTHRDAKKVFFNLLHLEKKALIIVKAKVLVGFDLTKIEIGIHKDKKQVTLSQFPAPEIMSIETDLEYYDLQKGIISKFSEGDLTEILKNTKNFIREKAENGHLMQIANNQSAETIEIIRKLIESVGWELVSEKLMDLAKEKEKLPN